MSIVFSFSNLLDLRKVNSAIGQSTFKYAGAKDWNSLPTIFREMTSITSFKRSIYMYLRYDKVIKILIFVVYRII